jgi:hypothetical protein
MAFGINIKSSSGGGKATAMNNIIAKITKKIEANIDQIGKDIQADLKDKETPYRTGQTANAWKHKDRKYGFEIDNKKPWIGTLNDGRWNNVPRYTDGRSGPSKKRNWVQATVKRNTK